MPQTMPKPLDILLSTGDVLSFQEGVMAAERASWLTGALVAADVLPDRFGTAKVAPIVLGIASVRQRRGGHDAPTLTHLHVQMDPHYLGNTPTTEYFPHHKLRDRVRDRLEQRTAGQKTERAVIFPGYVFPEVDGGTVYFDDTLGEPDCTPQALRPAVDIVSQAYDIAGVVLGHKALARNSATHVPPVSLTSVIREGLAPDGRGHIAVASHSFRAAQQRLVAESVRQEAESRRGGSRLRDFL